MTMAGRGFFFDVRARKTPAHYREQAVLQLLVRLIAADRFEVRGACELKPWLGVLAPGNLGQC